MTYRRRHKKRWILISFFIAIVSIFGCGKSEKSKANNNIRSLLNSPPLLATHFTDFEDFKKTVDIKYEVYSKPGQEFDGIVRLKYRDVVSELRSGISQNDIVKVRDGHFTDAVNLIINEPYAIRNRIELNKIYKLSRRRPLIFGEGDVAFYDLALECIAHINFEYTELKSYRDTLEKGYINTFNHIVAQALITSIFSEKMAEFVADVHELKNMPELVSGDFTIEQMIDTNNNPVDNYVDMINNEIGQEIGCYLNAKLNITERTEWNQKLLSRYLNELTWIVSESTKTAIVPFSSENKKIKSFVSKIRKSSAQLPYSDQY